MNRPYREKALREYVALECVLFLLPSAFHGPRNALRRFRFIKSRRAVEASVAVPERFCRGSARGAPCCHFGVQIRHMFSEPAAVPDLDASWPVRCSA